MRRLIRLSLPILVHSLCASAGVSAAEATATSTASTAAAAQSLSVLQLIVIAGPVEFLLIGLSLLCYSLALQYVFTIKRDTLIPDGLADELHNILAEGPTDEAVESARNAVAGDQSMLGNIIAASLDKRDLGYEVMRETAEHRRHRRAQQVHVTRQLAVDVLLLGHPHGPARHRARHHRLGPQDGGQSGRRGPQHPGGQHRRGAGLHRDRPDHRHRRPVLLLPGCATA